MPKVIAQEKLTDWLNSISLSHELWVPQDKGGGICALAPYSREIGYTLKTKLQLSAKSAVFPQTEKLIEFSVKKDQNNPEATNLSVKSNNTPVKRVVWGIAPCDVAGIDFLTKIFVGNGYHDPYFKTKRENTIIVALTCQRPDNTCFCASVGGSPADAPSADLLMTKINNVYVVEVLTPKGGELIDNKIFSELSENDLPILEQSKQIARERLGLGLNLRPDLETAGKILEKFNEPYWREIAAACLSCGICTYVCPTCQCFNIADDTNGESGQRFRCWDSCMFPTYSLEASGHNPRQAKYQRFRNRINHKFNYMITNSKMLGCVGCGRCIKECPVGIDIRYIISLLLGNGC